MSTWQDAEDPARRRQLLLVEDNPLFADQIREAIQEHSQPWVVTYVSEGLPAIELIQQNRQRFDLALVDLGLPDVSGIEVIRAFSRQFPDTPVVVISVMSSEPLVLRAIEEGARGYLLKGESVEEITVGIAQVMQGIYPLSPALARILFKRLGQEPSHPEPSHPETTQPEKPEFKLTPRELETLRFLSRGLSYEQVAERMGVALSTIQWNVRNLYRKLNVRSQVQAVNKARTHDLI